MRSRKPIPRKFVPKNPKKYKGDATNIVSRSSYELRVMKYLDEHPNVLEWCSEEIAIPYISPVDNRHHRYFPDFLIKIKDINNNIRTIMIEVKPYSQTIPPEIKEAKSKKTIQEVITWGINQNKWTAAKAFCADRGWEFQLITEKDLGIKS